MKYQIAYLYYDLLNLYGDNGNIKALVKHLKNQNIDVEVKYLSINDKKDFNKYDLVYIGSGTSNNLLIALDDLLKYRLDIEKAIDNNKEFLITGNSIELFGKEIIINSEKIKCLNIFDYSTTYKKRTVKDVKYKQKDSKNIIIGFENHPGIINEYKYPLFENNEGINYKNFIGSYVIGPILVRNPDFCEYYIKRIIENKFKDHKYIEDDYEFEKKAYKINIESIN